MARSFAGTANLYAAEWAAVDITGLYLSLSFWMKPSSLPAASLIVAKTTPPYTTTTQYQCYLGGGGTLPTCEIGDATGRDTVTAGTAVQVGRWTHVAVVKDPALLTIFQNGKQDGQVTSTRSIQDMGSSFVIADREGNDFPFQGSIANVAVWPVALTMDEIVRLGRGTVAYTIRPESLAAFFPLDDYQSGGGAIDRRGARLLGPTSTPGYVPSPVDNAPGLPPPLPPLKQLFFQGGLASAATPLRSN